MLSINSGMTAGSAAKTRAAIAVLAVVLAAGLYFIDPARQVLAPKCVFKLLTGWSCPGCGLQRAAHALLHGRVAEAVGYNLFLLVSTPYVVAAVAAKWFVGGIWRERLERILFDRRLIIAYVVLFILWWIVRNLLHI